MAILIVEIVGWEGKAMVEQTCVRILGGNPDICDVLRSDLEELGFHPLQARYSDINPDDIIQILPCIIILELTLIDHDALSIFEFLLRHDDLQTETALVALVSENTMEQISLDDKFADFIKFPYDIAELGFRLRHLICPLQKGLAGNTIGIGSLSISPSEYEVMIDKKPVVLTYKEYELLKYLVIHNDRVSTREELLNSVWGENATNGSRTVDVHISRVRAKMGDIAGTYIKTIRGEGYILDPESSNI